MNRLPSTFAASLVIMFIASFGLTLLFSGLLVQIGLQSGYIGLLLFTFLVGTYVFCGLFTKTMRLPVFLHSGKNIQSVQNGQSIAAGLISFGSFIFLAGQLYGERESGLASFSGWLLGACLMVVLFAAAVNRTKVPTMASMLHPDPENRLYRSIALILITLAAAPLLVLQFSIAGDLGDAFLGLGRVTTIVIMALSIGLCLVLGGMQGLSIARMLAFVLIAIAFLTPAVMIAYKITGNPFPQFSYGTGALQPIAQIDREIAESGFDVTARNEHQIGMGFEGMFSYVATLITLGCGIAAMPHLLQHFQSSQRPEEARDSGLWAIAFLLLIISAAPALAAFYRVDIYTSLLGLQLSDLQEESAWIFNISGAGTIQAIAICGEYVASVDDVLAACGQGAEYFLSSEDISVNPSLLVLSSAILNSLPDIVTWILVLGAMIAVWSTADGLCLSLANAFCHDGYVSLLRPKAPQTMQLFVSRLFLVLVIIAAALLAINYDKRPEILLQVAVALSAAAVFPALVLRVWSRKTNEHLLITGMMSGFVVTAFLLYFMLFGPDLILASGDELQLVSSAEGQVQSLMPAGFIGMIAAFITVYLIRYVMHLQRKHDQKRREMIKRAQAAKEQQDVSAEPETV